MSARRSRVTVGSCPSKLRGLATVVGCLALLGCVFVEDPGETHPPPSIEPTVDLFEYSLRIADTDEILASGCGASRGGIQYEDELTIPVPLEQELVYEEQFVGVHEGTFSDDKNQDYYCGLGPTAIGVDSSYTINPKCFVVRNPEVFDALFYELIGYEGESVDWESEDSWGVSSIGLRVHLIQHDYGIVGVYADSPPCSEGQWTRFYKAIAPEEE